ncbi:MAG TPA: ABC transporter substrate-binding protein [Candidatus Moranbacteria bacterium]|nr:ABC transporter substrate-binding protein [Candidatus Moranbacteria bacterium]
MFYLLVIVFIASTATWGTLFYFSKTKSIPAYGGEYIEGIVGQPVYINPILSQSNDVDADLVQLAYSGLLKYDSAGNIISDLAENYEISEDKTAYTFHLKKNVTWHDGQPFTANDILFTVNLISDPSYKSPLRSNWQGIETEVVDDSTIIFRIKTPYAGFLNNLTFGILPKHIWEAVEPENFHLNELKLEPIGTGPYKYNSFQKDSKGNIISYKLIANSNYFEGKPYISKITFNFYIDEAQALDAFNRKEIMGINSLSSQKLNQIKNKKSSLIHQFRIPRYFSVFINQNKSVALANDEVREALSYATDRQEIIEKVLDKNGEPVYSPFLPGMIGYKEDLEHKGFNLEKSIETLEKNKWTKGEDGFRSKDGVPLQFNLVTTDWDELAQTAEILKSQWEKAGIKVNISTYSISDVQQNYIRPREYEALLFGQVMGADPDPYSFWHSSMKKDPGLNLSLFGSSETDKLIEDGRIEFDTEKRSESYVDFQKELEKESSAIFLYSPLYIYPVNKSVQGLDIKTLILPSKRFCNVNYWYIKTKRVQK